MDSVLFDEAISPDVRLMKFAHECIRTYRRQEPPYDALEVEFLVFCLRSALAAQRERDAQYLERRAGEIADGSPDSNAMLWVARIFRDEAKKIREG